VRDNAEKLISITAFSSATASANKAIDEFRKALREFIGNLKSVAYDFRNDYLAAFASEFENQRNAICLDEKGEINNVTLWKNFNQVTPSIQESIAKKMDTLYEEICRVLDTLLANDGPYEKITQETNRTFTKLLSDNVLDQLRKDVLTFYMGVENVYDVSIPILFWRVEVVQIDRFEKDRFARLLNNEFTDTQKKCSEALKNIVNAVYGNNLSSKKNGVNFSTDLSTMLNRFDTENIQKMAIARAESTHENIADIVKLGTGIAVNVTEIIREVEQAVITWNDHRTEYDELGTYMLTTGAENMVQLQADYGEVLAGSRRLMAQLKADCEKELEEALKNSDGSVSAESIAAMERFMENIRNTSSENEVKS
jgi:uncharacterized protein YukE